VRQPHRPRPRALRRRVECLGQLFEIEPHRASSPERGGKSKFNGPRTAIGK
jgi:hypothetical protein